MLLLEITKFVHSREMEIIVFNLAWLNETFSKLEYDAMLIIVFYYFIVLLPKMM